VLFFSQEWFRVTTCATLSSAAGDGAAYVHVPFALHPFVVVANIPGLSNLVLDVPVIRAILEG
jgi:ABC-type phosphate transport system substrate-binding protein